ncbi:hypothetical protein P7C71_g3498, partial [Lecanoromycetidae sp. Uapishka_2]
MPRQPVDVPFFDHGVSAREMAAQPSSPWYNHRNEPDTSDDFSFISAKRIREFLSENVDENADHFILFTTAGTVLGHDKDHDFAKCRRFGAFAGPTFRHHDEAIAKTGKPSTNKTITDGMYNGKVLKFVVQKGKSGLQAMIVEQEGVISAVVYCKQRTLMAAQLEKGKFGGELEVDSGKKKEEATDSSEGLTGELVNLDLKGGQETTPKDPKDGNVTSATDQEEGDTTSATGTKEGEDTSANDPQDGEATNATDKTEEDATLGTDSKGKGKDLEANGAEAEQPENKGITKVRILQLRAEGMAEGMAEDELKDFIMPKDFF